MSSRHKRNSRLVMIGVGILYGLTAIPPEELRLPLSPRLDEEGRVGFKYKEPGPSDPGGALRFRRLQMQDEKGEIPTDAMEKARRHVAQMKVGPLSTIKPDSWTWLGPGNIGGRIRSIAIQPTNPNEMWVGSVSGGIWRTGNVGASWHPVNDFMANLAVSTIIIDPVNSGNMYAGTGEGFSNIDAIQGAGVFKSTDSGVTWNQLMSTNNNNWFFVNRLAISPDGFTLLAATSPTFDANGNLLQNGGIWRSPDGGATWIRRTNAQTFDIDFHPTDSTLAIAGGDGIVQTSNDGGVTWNAATFNPVINPAPAVPNPLARRIEVAYAPSAPNTVYASVNQNLTGPPSVTYRGEIYLSTDGGSTFNRANTTDYLGGQGWYDNTVWVNPLDPTFVIVGGVHLWRSTDSGMNITQISDGSRDSGGTPISPHADHHVIVAQPGFNNTTNQRVFFGNDGGIYRTDIILTANLLQGWGEYNNQLGITQYYSAAGNASTGVIVGGTQDNGTLRYSGNTEGWSRMFGNDGGYCASDPTDSMFFYGESQNLAIHRSTDGGMSSSNIFTGISDANNSNNTNFIAPFFLDPNNPNTMLAGGINLWRSTNVKSIMPAPAWAVIKTALPPDVNGNNIPISAIVVSPITSNLIVVGHNNGDIYRTFNGTASPPTDWAKIDTATLPNRMVTRLTIDSTRATNWIYATFGGFGADNVYRTTDNGATWIDMTGTGATGLPSVPVRSLVFHPSNPNLLYVGTEMGVFTSDDGGVTWALPQNGPANVSVDELFWMGGDLIAATHGRGLYRASGGTYVDCNYIGTELGTFDQPFKTLTAALNVATTYRTIWLKPCTYTEPAIINKRVELRNLGGTAFITNP